MYIFGFIWFHLSRCKNLLRSNLTLLLIHFNVSRYDILFHFYIHQTVYFLNQQKKRESMLFVCGASFPSSIPCPFISFYNFFSFLEAELYGCVIPGVWGWASTVSRPQCTAYITCTRRMLALFLAVIVHYGLWAVL